MNTQVALPITPSQLKEVFGRYGVVRAGVFGSYARGDFRPDSDIDLLVALAPGRDYLDLGGLQYDLQELAGRRVDVVLEGTLRKRIRPYVEKDLVELSV